MARPTWKTVAVGGVALGAIGVIALVSRRSTGPAPPSRVALIGDSYAVGLGPELAKIIPIFKYEGRVGMSTLGWDSCTACGNWLPSFQPELVLVSLGVNDGSAPNIANYQTVVQRLHGIGARVVWIEPPAAVSTPSRAVIAALGVPTVPATMTPLSADGLHPRSYAGWALEVARAIGVA